MEHLLHYVWKHKLLPLRELHTTDGRLVDVIHSGLHNRDAGPDFFNAKVKIGGQLWVGNVEIHLRSSDWFRHRHDTNAAYDNVILHVVETADADISYPHRPQQAIPQLELPIPDVVRQRYAALTANDTLPYCRDIVARQPRLTIHSWLSALQVERLEQRTRQLMERHERCDRNWEHTLFVTLARNFGFGINGAALEQWARSIPLTAVAKHRDDLFQIEAIFFGQSGLLETTEKSHKNGEFTDKINTADPYVDRLKKEYAYLRHKFEIFPMDSTIFRFARIRPQNFPHIRIAQLAMLHYEQRATFSRLISAESIEEIRSLFDVSVSPFWQTHFTFSSAESRPSKRQLSDRSKDLLIINSIAPLLFAYGRYKGDETLCERAFHLLEQVEPEQNNVTRTWANAGIDCESAADSQALIQLTRNYCEPRDCLRCRFGHEYIRRHPDFLHEADEQAAF